VETLSVILLFILSTETFTGWKDKKMRIRWNCGTVVSHATNFTNPSEGRLFTSSTILIHLSTSSGIFWDEGEIEKGVLVEDRPRCINAL